MVQHWVLPDDQINEFLYKNLLGVKTEHVLITMINYFAWMAFILQKGFVYNYAIVFSHVSFAAKQ